MNNLIKFIIIGMVASIFGCQSVSPQRLQYLKGADPSKDRISIVDQEYFDVQNLSIRVFDEDEITEYVRAFFDNLLTEHEFENISDVYIITAKNHCMKHNKYLLGDGIKVASNTKRYKCGSEDDALEESLKSTISYCEWLRKKTKYSYSQLTAMSICLPSNKHAKKINGFLESSFCKKYTEIMSIKNESPTCGFVEPRIREYLAKSKNRPQIDLEKNLNAAKEKCGQLGFAVGTEAFGKCVLQLSSQ